MEKELNKGYALLTGATSGFGYELAHLLANDGYNLIIVARSSDRLHEVCDELMKKYKIDVFPITKDLFKASAAEEIYRETSQKELQVDILINNAGQGQYGSFTEYDLCRDHDLIHLNILNLVSLTKLYLRDMKKRNQGKILQLGSILSKYPTPLMSVYAATKAFVLSFSEGLINELKDTNITITVLLPGAADTDFFHKAMGTGTVTYKETDLYDPAKVAKDGYEALMSGESRIVSGIKSKLQAAASNVLHAKAEADIMSKQMQQSDKKDGRKSITHKPSRKERQEIKKTTGRAVGDLKDLKE